jgi:hypothetical protein
MGEALLGVAAIITAIGGIVLARQSKTLGQINAAVNHKAPHEPHLREIVVQIAEDVGRLGGQLDEHTDQDTINFGVLRDGQRDQTERMEEIAAVAHTAAEAAKAAAIVSALNKEK